ncbi:hypothetical protein VNO78_11014 [Psophocarpus tetragonolobus]|uniref:Uncharacterized protein n=1 Tax=Psophocarpus tetragonolobus TaxID=3891 RepID=A0AAN9XN19_PSOTE
MSEEIKEVRKRKRKRKRKEEEEEGGSVYAEKAPDFGALASLYPSFHPFVKLCPHPSIDWSDFNATRELTRVLLHHRHSLNWWIPDGHLCPTVTNRSNYIHWLHHLLSSNFISNHPNLSLRVLTSALIVYHSTSSRLCLVLNSMNMFSTSFPGFGKVKPSLFTLRASSLRHDYPLASKIVVKRLWDLDGTSTSRETPQNRLLAS